MKKSAFIAAVFFLCSQALYADVAVTIYNNNRALVRDTRDVTLKKDTQLLEFDDVASQIDPTSVLPKFLSDASKIKILEQNFDYDLVNRDKLLRKYIGQNIEIERTGEDKRGKLTGKLLSASGGSLVVQSNNGIVLNPQGEVSLDKLPEGLRLKPTLTWLVASDVSGTRKMEVSYQTSGIGWNADYVLVSDENDAQADITGWVTINNYSGATYKDAKLKLIAGDVNMVTPQARNGAMAEKRAMVMEAAAAPSFQEKSFFEYHIYELQRKATIKDNEIKQIEFITASKVPVKKVFTYNGAQNGQKVTVNLDLKNSKENNLGIPLPKGRVRVCKYDGDAMEFIGENMIDHTAKDAKMSLYIGNAFDITGERKQTEYRSESKSAYESFKITLKNSKDTPVEVNVVEKMYRWNNWKIEKNSDAFKQTDSNTAEFLVTVPANGEKEITYTVKYWWK
ncbi:MAG: DUF4139 domain-containing protein [Endomicrobia bacterium]|nr:DUF4139 domain-containing protein [Endomicrobiia bacterium]